MCALVTLEWLTFGYYLTLAPAFAFCVHSVCHLSFCLDLAIKLGRFTSFFTLGSPSFDLGTPQGKGLGGF